jgi:hypothetical protein
MRSAGWGQGLSVGLSVGILLGIALAASFQAWLAADVSPEPAASANADGLAESSDGASDPNAAPRLESRLSELRLRLDRERRLRSELEAQLAELSESGGEARDAAAESEGAPAAEGRVGDHWIDEEVLARARFSRSEIAALRERFESIELEKLYLRDRATREGWLERPRYAREMREIDQGYGRLRDEYGDDAYDWILFASGRPNRLVVQQVMDASEAADVGIQPGDLILRYDGRRVFDMRSLQRATTEGEPGSTTAVDLLRDGEPLRVFARRGPLGVALLMRQVEPSEPLY